MRLFILLRKFHLFIDAFSQWVIQNPTSKHTPNVSFSSLSKAQPSVEKTIV